MPLESVTRLLPSLAQLQTQVVLLSGGEPLLNPEWAATAQLLRANGLQVWLLTSGLSLAKHAHRAAELFDAITVSLDGTDAQTYAAIRGLDAFDKVCEGIRAAAEHGVSPSIRVTLQRANYRQLPKFVALARELGAREVSFLAVDVANPEAFGRAGNFANDLALRSDNFVERGIRRPLAYELGKIRLAGMTHGCACQLVDYQLVEAQLELSGFLSQRTIHVRWNATDGILRYLVDLSYLCLQLHACMLAIRAG